MVSFIQTFRETGVYGWLHLVLFLPALLWALVCAVLLGLRWKVPPVVAGAPLLAVPLLLGVGTVLAYGTVNDVLTQVDPAQRATLLAAGIAEGLGQGWMGLLVLPVAIVLGLGGLAAGVRGPRSWAVPALVFGVASVTALLPAVGLLLWVPLPWVVGRMLLYGLGVVPLALATANGHPRANGPEGGMVAAMAWASVVGATELIAVNAQWAHGFGALAMVGPEQKATILATLSSEIGSQASLGWAIFALAAVPAVVCAFRSGPEATEEEILANEVSPSPWRSLGRVLALAVWVLWAFAMVSSSPGSALESIARG